jgi:nicotinate-nucleotide adenylyltransferase
MNKIKKLAIMGGTFDPIHYGHLLMAEEARQAFGIDQVVFVPNNVPPLGDKANTASPAEVRLAMVELAIASNPHFSISRVEVDRPGPSYTIDTVRYFHAEFPQLAKLFCITGADAILDILSWKEYEKLLVECQFIAATRPGFSLEDLTDIVPQDLLTRISFLQFANLEISSTDIRRRVREGSSVKYLLPECVEEYIYKNGLYRES